jgi:acyl-CoA thioester hydrolase
MVFLACTQKIFIIGKQQTIFKNGAKMLNPNFATPNIFYTHHVSYGETDAMGVVYYAEYAHIFERSRTALSHAANFPYTEMEKNGIMLPVSELNIKYKRPARYDDVLQVRVAISEWKNASLVFSYEIYNEDFSQILTTGSTLHACANLQGKPVRIPEWLKDKFTKDFPR